MSVIIFENKGDGVKKKTEEKEKNARQLPNLILPGSTPLWMVYFFKNIPAYRFLVKMFMNNNN